MVIMESKTNSIEDERHYIGNLLDDEIFNIDVVFPVKLGGFV